jgi:hypothetical protein
MCHAAGQNAVLRFIDPRKLATSAASTPSNGRFDSDLGEKFQLCLRLGAVFSRKRPLRVDGFIQR